ncbi:MAG: DNA repair protein RadC [Candidatus Izimaplasma sp.]|nr:DNA repair protein RadC [Candidatus Izimaplasma bacterium]
MLKIKEIPKQERPRERFLTYPIETIQTHELIAIILRTGSRSESVIDLAKRLLYDHASLKDLSQQPISDLTKIKGIGKSKAIQLLAAFELGIRLETEDFKTDKKLLSPKDIFHFLKNQLEFKMQEHFIVLYLNTKGGLIKKKTLFIGSLNQSLVHPREIFKHAVLTSSASLILVHNHPSGDPTPSTNDIDITKLIKKNADMMNIKLLDHVIIGRNRFVSFKEKGLL